MVETRRTPNPRKQDRQHSLLSVGSGKPAVTCTGLFASPSSPLTCGGHLPSISGGRPEADARVTARWTHDCSNSFRRPVFDSSAGLPAAYPVLPRSVRSAAGDDDPCRWCRWMVGVGDPLAVDQDDSLCQAGKGHSLSSVEVTALHVLRSRRHRVHLGEQGGGVQVSRLRPRQVSTAVARSFASGGLDCRTSGVSCGQVRHGGRYIADAIDQNDSLRLILLSAAHRLRIARYVGPRASESDLCHSGTAELGRSIRSAAGRVNSRTRSRSCRSHEAARQRTTGLRCHVFHSVPHRTRRLD